MGESVLSGTAVADSPLFEDAGLERRAGSLHLGGVPLSAVADAVGTPTYLYNARVIRRQFRALDQALADLPHRVAYAVKANANLAVLRVLRDLGAGADIVSGGELARALAAGFEPERIVFSGVGKTDAELTAAVEAGIGHVHLESTAELAALGRIVERLRRPMRVGIRVNPDVTAETHPYIATGQGGIKFGVPVDQVVPLALAAARHPLLTLDTIAMHIGSQLLDAAPYAEGVRRLLDLVTMARAAGVDSLRTLDMGGGLGIRYRDEAPVPLADYAAMLAHLMQGRPESLVFEPGRLLVGDAGVLLTRVEYLKRGSSRSFAIVDAAMNDLLRPALYDAWHPVDAVRPRGGASERWQVVGPICESGDFLAHDRDLALEPGDLLAIGAAGAYAMAMSSNYNARPRACEVLVDGQRAHLVRRRERVEDLFAGESLAP